MGRLISALCITLIGLVFAQGAFCSTAENTCVHIGFVVGLLVAVVGVGLAIAALEVARRRSRQRGGTPLPNWSKEL